MLSGIAFWYVMGSPNTSFFGKCFKKKLLNIFSNLFFYLKVQSFHLVMENNFIQMVASAGHAVPYTIGRIFKHIIDCVQLYFTNGFTNIVLWSVNCFWVVGVALIFDGTPEIIVQWCQIAAPRWPNDNDNESFKNRALNIECSFGCVARSSVLFFVNKNSINMSRSVAIDCNGLYLLIFEEKFPNYASGSKSTIRFGCVGFSMYACGFCLFTYPSRSKWASSDRRPT